MERKQSHCRVTTPPTLVILCMSGSFGSYSRLRLTRYIEVQV